VSNNNPFAIARRYAQERAWEGWQAENPYFALARKLLMEES
jgi:hypothetical protein